MIIRLRSRRGGLAKLILSVSIIFAGIITAILLIIKALLPPAPPYREDVSGQRTDEFNVIINAAIADQAPFGVFLKEPSDLYEALFVTHSSSDDPLVLDIRSSEEYYNGHIPGAINIYWRDIAKKKSLDYLNSELAKHAEAGKKNQIVVYHNTQHEQGWVATFLNMMDYDKDNMVEVISWGLAAWTQDETVAPGRWKECTEWASDGTGISPPGCSRNNYSPIDKVRHPRVAGKGWPILENTSSPDPHEIIRAAGDRWFSDKDFNPGITAIELHALLNDDDPTNDPYILSNRDIFSFRFFDSYNRGHIPGAHPVSLGKEGLMINNSDFLPTDRPIVVYCWLGVSQQYMAAVLNMLGYRAMSLDWGISSWSTHNIVVIQKRMANRYTNDYPIERNKQQNKQAKKP